MSIASRERQGLAELLVKLGPDEPTLCAGWTTRDLAAHLMIREHRPIAALGILIKPLAGWNARIMKKSAPNFAENIALLKAGAPWWSPLRWFDSQANTFEFLIHHEDVRRAQPDWKIRDLTAIDNQLKVLVKRFGRTVGPSVLDKLVGEPMEILFYLAGRKSVAQVDVSE